MDVIWLLYGCYMVVIWLLYGCYMVVIYGCVKHCKTLNLLSGLKYSILRSKSTNNILDFTSMPKFTAVL